MPSLILASASPRRAQLLQQIGVPFTQAPAAIDETPLGAESALAYVERLAREKALAGRARVAGDNSVLVLGSDTSVVCDGQILGKPLSGADARDMLNRLSGRSHQVMTAIALAGPAGCRSRVVITEVAFRRLGQAEIDAYCATGEPMDKAGAYGIQGRGGIFVECLTGSYSAVVGLPLQETAALLEEAGLPVWALWGRDAPGQTN